MTTYYHEESPVVGYLRYLTWQLLLNGLIQLCFIISSHKIVGTEISRLAIGFKQVCRCANAHIVHGCSKIKIQNGKGRTMDSLEG